jgi:hypothetical protein
VVITGNEMRVVSKEAERSAGGISRLSRAVRLAGY